MMAIQTRACSPEELFRISIPVAPKTNAPTKVAVVHSHPPFPETMKSGGVVVKSADSNAKGKANNTWLLVAGIGSVIILVVIYLQVQERKKEERRQ